MHFVNLLKQQSKAFAQSEDGVAFIEFAFAVTILLVLFLGSVELTRYVLIIQKLEKSVSEVTDVVTQTDPTTSPLNDQEMAQLVDAIQYMMYPYSTMSSSTTSANTRIIVTDVKNTSSTATPNAVIEWQFCSSSGLTSGVSSKLGTTVGGTVTDADFGAAGFSTGSSGFLDTMQSGEELVIGEIYFSYAPITSQNLLKATTLYRTAAFMPRLGALTTYSPNHTSPTPNPVPSTCP